MLDVLTTLLAVVLLCCRTDVALTMARMSSFLILSRLVFLTAFLRHLISHVTNFLSRVLFKDHVWHWYVSVGRKMALMSFALTLMGMLGCFRRGARW